MDWVTLTMLEGIGLGVSRYFFSLGGAISPALAYILFALVCAGLCQMLIGLVMTRVSKARLIASELWHIIGPIALGLGGLAANTCAFAAFQASSRAEMAASTFLATVPVILLSAVFGRIKYGREKEPFGLRQVIGVLFAIVGAYLTIGFSVRWGIWAWFSLGTAVFATTNEFISKEMALWETRNGKPKLNKWVLQFWGGVMMIVAASAGFFILADDPAQVATTGIGKLGLYGIGAGICNVAWWTCRLTAYQGGAPVSIRRFPAIGMALLTSTLIGLVALGEPRLGEKLLGISLYIPAFFFGQNGSEKYLRRLLVAARSRLRLRISPSGVSPVH